MNTKCSDKSALKFSGNFVNYLVFTTKSLSDNINPSNKSDRSAYILEKKQLSMLIFNVFPNRLGRVMSVTSSWLSHHCFMKSVLSM